ncbi:MAG: DUF58 domain-containing protein [Syntrophobacteraceae bacterium]|nr:DUF58 domain-containing protein [Syntrophobacteraceae bacterium]
MIKINKAGYIYILLTILVGFAAVNTANNLVYIIASALLSYMLVSGIFGRANIYGVKPTVRLPGEIYAGTETPVQVQVANPGRFLPALLIRVEVEKQKAFFPFIPPRSAASAYVPLRFDRRGRYKIHGVTVTSVFPFNFFTRFRTIPVELDVTVFPKPTRCDLVHLEDPSTKLKGETSSNQAGYDSDILAIRDYAWGDPPKYICWKSTAKTGRIKTKELSSIQLRQVMIDMDSMEKKSLESLISCVTYLVLKYTRTNIPVGLTLEGRIIPPNSGPVHRIRLLTRLALYGEN